MNELRIACENGNIDVIQRFINDGFDINQELDEYGWTPLIFASDNGHKEIVEMLMRAGADIEKADKYGWTPLIVAINNGHKEIVEILIRAGADIEKANKYGWTPLIIASNNGYKEIVEMLIRAGADMEKADQVWMDSIDLREQLWIQGNIEILIREYKKKVSSFLIGLSETENPIYLLNGFEHIQRYIISMALPMEALKEIPELF